MAVFAAVVVDSRRFDRPGVSGQHPGCCEGVAAKQCFKVRDCVRIGDGVKFPCVNLPLPQDSPIRQGRARVGVSNAWNVSRLSDCDN